MVAGLRYQLLQPTGWVTASRLTMCLARAWQLSSCTQPATVHALSAWPQALQYHAFPALHRLVVLLYCPAEAGRKLRELKRGWGHLLGLWSQLVWGGSYACLA